MDIAWNWFSIHCLIWHGPNSILQYSLEIWILKQPGFILLNVDIAWHSFCTGITSIVHTCLMIHGNMRLPFTKKIMWRVCWSSVVHVSVSTKGHSDLSGQKLTGLTLKLLALSLWSNVKLEHLPRCAEPMLPISIMSEQLDPIPLLTDTRYAHHETLIQIQQEL